MSHTNQKDLNDRRAEQDRYLHAQRMAVKGPASNTLSTRRNGLLGTYEFRLYIAESETPVWGSGFKSQVDAEQAAEALANQYAQGRTLMYPAGYLDSQAWETARLRPSALDRLLAGPRSIPTAPSPKGLPQVTLYTDGSNYGQPGPAGWGALLVFEGRELELSGPLVSATNNQAELTAVIEGLKALKKSAIVTLVSDSQYVVEGLEKRLAKWVRTGWRLSTGGEVKNQDLWEQLLALKETHQITATWVKGHNGHPENERVDKLAGLASRAEKARQEAERPEPVARPLATYKPCDICGRMARLMRLGTTPERRCPSCYDDEMARRKLAKQAEEAVRRR